jgi:phage terminase large subunit GpA-like protein
MLTGGVDVQETSLYYTIRAWGDYTTSQNIVHGQVLSFADIEQIMNLEYVKENGQRMIVNLCLIDSGYMPDDTYDFCLNNSDWAMPVKGASNPMNDRWKISKINKENSKAYGMQLVIVDGGQIKDSIAARMKRQNGAGSWMVYQGCDVNYAQQVTSEHKVNEKQGNKVVKRWVQKISHADNHYLDCEVYAMAAAEMRGVRSLHLECTEVQQPKVQERSKSDEENWFPADLSNWLGG